MSISLPHRAYEGDHVAISCTGEKNHDIRRLKYFKDGSHIATYSSASSYTIANARFSDSGSYFCKADRKLFLFVDVTEETRHVWLDVQGRGSFLEWICLGRRMPVVGKSEYKAYDNYSRMDKWGWAVCPGVWMCVVLIRYFLEDCAVC